MRNDDDMDLDERYKYLRRRHNEYAAATRGERTPLLSEAQRATGLSRDHLSRLLTRPGPIRKQRHRERGATYGPDIRRIVGVVAESLDWICAERLRPVLAETARHLASFGELQVTEAQYELLERISTSTVERMLKHLRQDVYRLPRRRGRGAPSGLAAEIPATRMAWDLAEPGHFEVDLVQHSGPDTRGDYVCTMQWIDVATGWSERQAIYGRGSAEVLAACRAVVARVPFPVREVHPDNGPEFLNHPLVQLLGDIVQGVRLSRSRPWIKNDNRFVEQKNYTLVRAYLGDDRLASREQRDLWNGVLELLRIYNNCFQPVLRMVEKSVVRDDSGRVRIRRKHDEARTPLQRVLLSNALPAEQVTYWQSVYEETNPNALRKEIHGRLMLLYAAMGRQEEDTAERPHRDCQLMESPLDTAIII